MTGRLRAAHSGVQRILDDFDSFTFDHHPRAFNRMADALTNFGMDARRSFDSDDPTSDTTAHERRLRELQPADLLFAEQTDGTTDPTTPTNVQHPVSTEPSGHAGAR